MKLQRGRHLTQRRELVQHHPARLSIRGPMIRSQALPKGDECGRDRVTFLTKVAGSVRGADGETRLPETIAELLKRDFHGKLSLRWKKTRAASLHSIRRDYRGEVTSGLGRMFPPFL